MSTQTDLRRFPRRTVQQVRLDANRSLVRSHFCPDRSEVLQVRPVEVREETEKDYGRQLWYFEAVGVDEVDRRFPVFGAIEYSVQYGLMDLIDDGVFDSDQARAQVRRMYLAEGTKPTWKHPGHRYLLVGVVTMGAAYAAFLASRLL